MKPGRIAQGITGGMDFGAESTFTATNALGVSIPPFCPSAVLVGADDGAVNPLVLVVGVAGQSLKDPLPHPGFGPAPETGMNFAIMPKALWQIPPGHPGPIAIQHGFDKQAVVRSGHAHLALRTGQEILNASPLVIPEGIASSRHDEGGSTITP